MNQRDTRFVAHIDILGMSAIVERSADAGWGLLSDLVDALEITSSYEFEFLDTKERVAVSEAMHSVTFSDTILLFTKGSSDIELRCMILRLTELFHLALQRCVPIRVGVSLGTFFFNFEKSMYAGPALIDAYRTGEYSQWLGIVLSDSVKQRAVDLGMMSGESEVVVPWSLPIKLNGCAENKSYMVINWPAIFVHGITAPPPISIEQFYQPFKETFGVISDLPDDVLAKYRNTVDFLNEYFVKQLSAIKASLANKS